LVWENVPGVLSSNSGKDFGVFLGALGELGYGFAYRILDAQYFGVAQRRRRVFVVGYLGDWRPAAAVLFERHSLSGNPAPSREKRESVASSVREGVANSSWPAEISSTLDTTFGTKQGLEDQHVNAGCPMFVPAQPIALAENTIGRQPHNGGNGDGFTDGGPMYTLNATGVHGVAQPVYEMHGQDSRVRDLGDTCTTVTSKWGTGGGNVPVTIEPIPFGVSEKPDVGHCLRSGASKADKHESTTYVAQPMVLMDQGGSVMNVNTDGTVGTLRRETHGHEPVVIQRMAVRRLTPVECERLQGFPDNYTDIKPKGKPTPDGPRYKALGNSMAVPVMAWIGQRIQEVEAICKQNK
jgi:DNA (cytosine-5)-methyltransferase 1